MKKEAETHAEEDKKRKDEVETINQADALVFSSEKLFSVERFAQEVIGARFDPADAVGHIKEQSGRVKRRLAVRQSGGLVSKALQRIAIAQEP